MRTLCIALIILLFASLSCIEVSGTISEDTMWSQFNSPYEVVGNITVSSGVTLTIEPGVEVQMGAAILEDVYDWDDNFWLRYGDSVAKMIRVDGSLIAVGTEQDSILFTRAPFQQNYMWGNIYLPEGAGFCRLEHCHIEYSAGIGIRLGFIAWGALTAEEGAIWIDECLFLNCSNPLMTICENDPVFVSNSKFELNHQQNEYYYITSLGGIGELGGQAPQKLIGGCHYKFSFERCSSITAVNADVVYCTFDERRYGSVINVISDENRCSYVYMCLFDSFYSTLDLDRDGAIVIESNEFIGNTTETSTLNTSDPNVLIRYNYFENSSLWADSDASGDIIGNVFNNSPVSIMGEFTFSNNILNNYTETGTTDHALGINYNGLTCDNNLICGNSTGFSGSYMGDINNCILFDNVQSIGPRSDEGITIRNCLLDFEIPDYCIDGGDNIIMDTEEIREQFVDYEDDFFYPVYGAVMVDAGYEDVDLDYPFDLGHCERVWDGDFDDVARIDIGPYEYFAPRGGIVRGQVLEEETSEPVQYAYITLDEDPLLYTFTDAEGNFEFVAPIGDHDLYARRVFYESTVITGLTLVNDQFTDIDFTMRCLLDEYTDSNDETVPEPPSLTLSNHPNPFNPETTISFSIPTDGHVELAVYNIRGQKVRTLMNSTMDTGSHSIVWDGSDESRKSVASGVYFYKITAENETVVRKMLLMK